jgi:ketosteroid isomerase-like protein
MTSWFASSTRHVLVAGSGFAVLLSSGCQPHTDLEREQAGLLQADRDCATASVEVGFVEAYRRCLADDAMVMPPGQYAQTGREEICATWTEEAGDGALEWEPRNASVSQSGDWGWTWGSWVFTTTGEADAAVVGSAQLSVTALHSFNGP